MMGMKLPSVAATVQRAVASCLFTSIEVVKIQLSHQNNILVVYTSANQGHVQTCACNMSHTDICTMHL